MSSFNLSFLKQFSVLMVEDDDRIRSNMVTSLSMMFNAVFTAADAIDAYRIYQQEQPDFLLTDINMPLEDGLTLIEKIRATDSKTAIIIISAYSNEDYLMRSANLQIDGYIVKPVSLDKLLVTFENSTKRLASLHSFKTLINIYDDYYFDRESMQLLRQSKPIRLGKKETRLIALLCNNANRFTSREEISREVWGREIMSDSALKNLISSCRKKIGKDAIINSSGIGWRLNLPKR